MTDAPDFRAAAPETPPSSATPTPTETTARVAIEIIQECRDVLGLEKGESLTDAVRQLREDALVAKGMEAAREVIEANRPSHPSREALNRVVPLTASPDDPPHLTLVAASPPSPAPTPAMLTEIDESLEHLERDLEQHYRNDAWLPAPQTSAHYARTVRRARDELTALRSSASSLAEAEQMARTNFADYQAANDEMTAMREALQAAVQAHEDGTWSEESESGIMDGSWLLAARAALATGHPREGT